MLGAFAFQAVGALAGTAVGYAVLVLVPNLSACRWMYATAVVPALLVTIGRSTSPKVRTGPPPSWPPPSARKLPRYLLTGEVFPTVIRGKGAGFAGSLCQD